MTATAVRTGTHSTLARSNGPRSTGTRSNGTRSTGTVHARQPRHQPRPQRGRAVAIDAPAVPTASADAPVMAAVYRRRRLAVLAALLGVLLGIGLLATRVGQADAGLDGPPPPPAIYVVQPGDTLWSIADKVAPSTDRREAVGQLGDAAGGTDLVPGQRIELPRGLR